MNSYQNICIEVEQIKDIQQKIKISGSEGLQVLDHISIYDDIDFKNHIDCNCDNEYFELDLDKFYLKIPIFCRISESKLTFIIQTQTKQYIYQELLQFEQLFKVNLRVTSGRFSIQYFNQQQLLQGQTSLQLSDQQKVIRNEDYKPQQLNCLTQSISAPVSPINFIFQIKTKNFLFEINATYQNRSLVENIQPISQVRCKQSVTLQYKLYASLKAPQLFKLAFDDFYVRGPEEVSLAAGEVKIIQLTIVAKKCGQLYIPTFYSTEIESINGCELYNCRNNIINVGDYIVDLKQ
ncbi:hypothetical protein SS50377_25429 [Spironucleus salmonicida]|nr:hypothetical protein SS50377_25429 [Spironucleus salmonicida]